MQLRKLIVPVAAAALSVTACGGDDSGDETPDNGDAAGDESSADDAEDAGETEDSDDESAGDDAESGGGDVDEAALFEAIANAYIDAGSFEFEAITSETGEEMTMTGAMEIGSDGSTSGMRMTYDLEGVETNMLIVDDQIYVEMTEAMGIPGGGEGSWLTFGSEGGDQLSQGMGDAFDGIGSAADLSAKLAENADLITATEVGTATVEGVETTEYEAVVNDVAAYTGVEGDAAASEITFTMWIDGDNLPRRVVQRHDDDPPVELIYKNFGADVDISAPPEDEVVDFNDMMNQ